MKAVKPGIRKSKRGNGTEFYVARIRMPAGEQTKRFSRLRDAEAWLASQRQRKERILAGLEEAAPRRPTRALGTVAEEMQRFIDGKSDISVRTQADYNEILRNVIAQSSIARLKVTEVTAADVQQFVRVDLYGRESPVGEKRVRKAVVLLGAMTAYLVAADRLTSDPVAKAKRLWPGLLRPPASQRRDDDERPVLSVNQVREIAGFIPDDIVRTVVTLMAVTGLRIGEVLALTDESLDLDQGRLLVEQALTRVGRAGDEGLLAGRAVVRPKSGKTRTVLLSQSTVDLLVDYLGSGVRPAGCSWLFPRSNGEPLRYDRVAEAWKAAVEAAGVNGRYTLHDIRRAFASTLVLEGLDVRTVGSLLGHAPSSIQATTMAIYARPSEDRAEQAVRGL